jgi:hypothetical protein
VVMAPPAFCEGRARDAGRKGKGERRRAVIRENARSDIGRVVRVKKPSAFVPTRRTRGSGISTAPSACAACRGWAGPCGSPEVQEVRSAGGDARGRGSTRERDAAKTASNEIARSEGGRAAPTGDAREVRGVVEELGELERLRHGRSPPGADTPVSRFARGGVRALRLPRQPGKHLKRVVAFSRRSPRRASLPLARLDVLARHAVHMAGSVSPPRYNIPRRG